MLLRVCKERSEMGMYETPKLNTKLYLNHLGIEKIEVRKLVSCDARHLAFAC
jgi:hypothetical protein